MPAGGHADLLVMAVLTGLLLPLSVYRERRIGRPGGLMLLMAFVVYIMWRACSATA